MRACRLGAASHPVALIGMQQEVPGGKKAGGASCLLVWERPHTLWHQSGSSKRVMGGLLSSRLGAASRHMMQL